MNSHMNGRTNRSMRVGLLHPSVMLIYYVGLLAIIFLCTHPLYRFTVAAGVISLAFFFAGHRHSLQQLKFMLPVGLLLGLLNPLFVHRGSTILFYFWGNPVTLEAAAYGMYNALLILTVVMLFVSFNCIIDQAAFLYLTSRRLPRTAFVVNMALHSVSRFSTRAAELSGVQYVRGIRLREGSLRKKLNQALLLLKALTVRSLEEGMETAEVLRARDYGIAKRTAYRSYPFGLRDVISLLGLVGLLFIIIYPWVTGAAHYSFYPRLGTLSLSVVEAGALVCLALYMAWPLAYEYAPLLINLFSRNN